MVDIYFVQSILNIIWYIFSILFVLYKFTSFFSYIWNFVIFLGKITKGIAYLFEQVKIFISKRHYQQSELPRYNDEVNPLINRGIDIKDDPALRRDSLRVTTNQTIFTKTKNKINDFIFGKQKDHYIPLTDTRLSYIDPNLMDDTNNSDASLNKRDNIEKSLFDKHIDSTMQSNYSDMSDIDGFKNVKINFQSSSMYPPPQKNPTLTRSNLEENSMQNQEQKHIMSSLLSSELTENPFAEDISSENKNNKLNDSFEETKQINSNMFFESTFIKKWLNK